VWQVAHAMAKSPFIKVSKQGFKQVQTPQSLFGQKKPACDFFSSKQSEHSGTGVNLIFFVS
jgi:hypothetical protein